MLGVEMVVTLGALIADVAHTLPVPITGLASDEELVERLDLARSNYEGPTGVVGVLHDACRRRGIPSASLWAAVPHYVAAVPNPKAALALLRRLEGLVGVAVEASGLEEESESYESQVTRAVAANPEIEELVQRLEDEQAERLDVEEDVPSGESLARDFERYLRQQGGGSERASRPAARPAAATRGRNSSAAAAGSSSRASTRSPSPSIAATTRLASAAGSVLPSTSIAPATERCSASHQLWRPRAARAGVPASSQSSYSAM